MEKLCKAILMQRAMDRYFKTTEPAGQHTGPATLAMHAQANGYRRESVTRMIRRKRSGN